MNHRATLTKLLLPFLFLLAIFATNAATPRPNILYILADDLGVGDISAYNTNSIWKTPHIDRLAREGRLFTDAHSASGVCTPSRYTLLTGRYSWRGKLKSAVLNGYSPSLLESNRLTVASFLRSQGYATAMIGKWHLGLDWVRNGPQPQDVDFSKPFGGGPTAHGFDSYFGISASLDMPPYVYLENNRAHSLPTQTTTNSPAPKMWRAGVISPDFKFEEVHPRFAEKSLQYLATRAQAPDQKPFFLYLALTSPHTPVLPTAPFEGKTKTPYGDFVTQVDATLAQLLDALAQHNLATNTLIIFTADNGFAPAADLPAHKKLNHDPSAGFRGHKADLYEGGHRIPFIARWPGVIPPNTRCPQTIGHLDLLATCADILSTKLPDTAAEDSASILPLLCGANESPLPREALIHQSNNGFFAIRQGPWKLLFTSGSGGWSYPRPNTPDTNNLPPLQLYNLNNDPTETNNLQATNPEIVQRLTKLIHDHFTRGRSTPGPTQPFENPSNWPQAAPFRDQ